LSNIRPTLLNAETLHKCFAENYAQAHSRFVQLAKHHRLKTEYQELAYAATGPMGEKLVTAVAWFGNLNAPRVLVIQSATHGVEGFAGSAIQMDALMQLEQATLPEGVALCCIHAINPYGFAWLRRVNEQGIDLNRNFIDFTQALPVNEAYRELAHCLLPVSEEQWDLCKLELENYRKQSGQQAYELAVSGGQYEFSDGLFYGGQSASQSNLYLRQLIESFRLDQRQFVTVIDIHSGLGPFGYGEVICDHPPGSAGVRWAREWFGESVTEPALGSSSSVPKQGLIDYLWQQQLADQVCFITLEFGTYSIEKMFDALRKDHLLHRQPVDWLANNTQSIKQNLRNIFYPASADWQEMVLIRGRQLVGQALNGLSC